MNPLYKLISFLNMPIFNIELVQLTANISIPSTVIFVGSVTDGGMIQLPQTEIVIRTSLSAGKKLGVQL